MKNSKLSYSLEKWALIKLHDSKNMNSNHTYESKEYKRINRLAKNVFLRLRQANTVRKNCDINL